MKKLLVLVGIGVGYLLGSRAGRGPYEQVEHQVRGFLGRPDVHDRIEAARNAASRQFSDAAGKATSKLPGSGNSSTPPSAQGSETGDVSFGTE